MLKTKELIILPDNSNQELYDKISDTIDWCGEKLVSRVYPLLVDLTDKIAVKRMFGNFSTHFTFQMDIIGVLAGLQNKRVLKDS